MKKIDNVLLCKWICYNKNVCLSIKNNLSCFFFTRVWVSELYPGETRRTVPQFLACKTRQLELWNDVGIEFHVESYLRNEKFCLWHHNIYFLY